MANNVKKIGIDLGNRITSAAVLKDGVPSYTFYESIYKTDSTVSSSKVTINGVSLAIGEGNVAFNNVDKTLRPYLDYQIAKCCYDQFGAGSFYTEIAVGLPLSTYRDKDKREKYAAKIKALSPIQAEVQGNKIEINITKVTVVAEGHASLRPLYKYLDVDDLNLVIDIGMKTTDVIFLQGNKQLNGYETINIALQDIYNSLSNVVMRKTGLSEAIPPEVLDNKIKSSNTVLKGIKENVDLLELIKDKEVLEVITNMFDEIERKFGQMVRCNVILTGGASNVVLKAINEEIKDKYLRNMAEVSENLRYYSNCLGYLLALN